MARFGYVVPLLFAVFLPNALICNAIIDFDYYWRDYEGVVPFDAFIGGQDSNGQPIYIGQTLYGATVLTSKIYPDDNKAYYTWGGELSSTENVKIFCTQHPEKLKWVDTTKDGLGALTGSFLVKGGYDNPHDLYIGRAFHKRQTLVGRVRSGSAAYLNKGLYISVPEKEVIVETFQVLTFDPNGSNIDSEYCKKNVVILKS